MSILMPTHLSLFSGIGGIDLAAHWAGWETVALCEANPFCQQLLRKHWPTVSLFPDVRALDATALRSVGVHQVDLISGGYPCQPFSFAGRRGGETDARHLWPEFRRLVGELRPRWVLGENVPGHLSLGVDDVLADLDGLGYRARVFVFPAEAVGAKHRRERVFWVANAEGQRWPEGRPQCSGVEGGSDATCGCPALAHAATCGRTEGSTGTEARQPDAGGHGCLGHSRRQGSPEREGFVGNHGTQQPAPLGTGGGSPEPGMGGTPDGLPGRLDRHPRVAGPHEEQFPEEPPRTVPRKTVFDRASRVGALGNAVDPYQVLPILQAIFHHHQLLAQAS